MRARVVAVANCKGGTGKSTTAVNLAAELAARGRRVLVVDLDPQGHAGAGFGVSTPAAEDSVHEVFRRGPIDLAPFVRTGPGERIAVLPADRQFRLSGGLAEPDSLARSLEPLRQDYDAIVIDTPPSADLPLLAALASAQCVLVPTQLQHLAHDGLLQFTRIFFEVASSANSGLEGFAIVPVQVDMRTQLQRLVLARLLRDFGGSRIFRGIRTDIALAEAFGSRCPVLAYRPGCRGAADYGLLAQDVSTFWHV